MGYNCGIYIHPEIDALQGEVRMPRELTGRRSVYFCLKFTQSNVIYIQDNHPFFCWPSQDGSSDIFTCAYDIYSCLTTKKMMTCSGIALLLVSTFQAKNTSAILIVEPLMSLWSSLKVEDLKIVTRLLVQTLQAALTFHLVPT